MKNKYQLKKWLTSRMFWGFVVGVLLSFFHGLTWEYVGLYVVFCGAEYKKKELFQALERKINQNLGSE